MHDLEHFRVAVTDAARQPLLTYIRDLHAQLSALRKNPPGPDEEDWCLIAEQMIGFCQGIAAPDDIEDIRLAFRALGMSARNVERTLHAMRQLEVPA